MRASTWIESTFTGAAGSVKPGTYAFREGTGWKTVIEALHEGRVLTARLVIPEGWNLEGIAPRVQEITGVSTDSFYSHKSWFAARDTFPEKITHPILADTNHAVSRAFGTRPEDSRLVQLFFYEPMRCAERTGLEPASV